MQAGLRILLVAENLSWRLSGETVVPCHYLAQFLAAGHDVRVLCHARCREDLRADLPPAMFGRIHFVEDTALQRAVHRIGLSLPYRVQDLVSNLLISLLTQLAMRRAARRLIAAAPVDVVFQPAPIAAKAISAMYGLGRPVVIGPMSGGMELPPAFRHLDGPVVTATIDGARRFAGLLHRLIPGKLRAAALIVANRRTRAALPVGVRGVVHEMMESGVDLQRWPRRPGRTRGPDEAVSFIFCGRFVDWKGIGYLVRAFAPLARSGGVRLDLVGDGELFDTIKRQVAAQGLSAQVVLHGRVPIERYMALLREADVFVTPSLRECGGMAMMEAMAVGLPVVGVDWGGAAQYAGHAHATLVKPSSEAALVHGLTHAMRRLAGSAALRERMGAAGRRHLEASGRGWDTIAAQVAGILSDTVLRYDRRHPALAGRGEAPLAIGVAG